MSKKLIALSVAIVTGLALPALADRDRGGDNRRHGPSFSEIDTDQNGLITVEELEAVATLRFQEIDTNGDGELSAEELIAHRTPEDKEVRDAERKAERAERMIERFDENDNGTVSQAELEESRRGPDFERLMARYDTNEDGGLSEKEFRLVNDHRGGGHKHKRH